MGDRTSASITIYGTIETIEQFSEIAVALAAEAIMDVNDVHLQDDADVAKAILAALDHPSEGLHVHGHEVNYGTFDAIESACIDCDMPFVATWESGGDYSEGRKTWTRENGEVVVSTLDGAVAFSIGEIRAALATSDPAAGIRILLSEAEKAEGNHMPSLAVSDVVLAHLKCVAAGDGAPFETLEKFTVLLLLPDWMRADQPGEGDWVRRVYVDATSPDEAFGAAQDKAVSEIVADLPHREDELKPEQFAVLAVYAGHIFDLHQS